MENLSSREIILVYENIVREYDNALLLKAEFERRGYQVRLVHKVYDILWKHRAAIVIVPNCYHTLDFKSYTYFLNCNGSIYFDLRYEQVMSKRVQKIGYHNPKGKAKNIHHFCWGQKGYEHLLQAGVPRKHLTVSGALQLDFLRPEFQSFYLDRHKIAQNYQLKEDKKWLLYISSFTFVENAAVTKYTAGEFKDDAFIQKFSQISAASQKATLEWFEKLVAEREDVIIIYRKHPVEAGSTRLKQLTEKYPYQIRDISGLSVKQWIKVCDITTTWFSTSAAEVYLSQKPLFLIRPYAIDEEFDIPFYYHADCVDSYEKLRSMVCNCDLGQAFPVPKAIVQQYYDTGGKPAYVTIVDTVAKIAAASPQGIAEKGFQRKRWKFLIGQHIILKYGIKKIYQAAYACLRFRLKDGALRKNFAVTGWEEDIDNRKNHLNKIKFQKIKQIVGQRE